jgi:hypothetical protein
MSLDDEIQVAADNLSRTLKSLYEFLLEHLDRDPEEHWPLWASEQGVPSNDKTARRRYDQQRKRLREHFLTYRAREE